MLSAMGKVAQQKAGLLLQLTRGGPAREVLLLGQDSDNQANTEERLMEQACNKAKEFVLKTDTLTADRKFPVMFMLEGLQSNIDHNP
jgi:hypothetical protein